MNIGDKVKFKNPLNYDKGIAQRVGNSTVKKIQTVSSQEEANKVSMMVSRYFAKKKVPIEVANLDSGIAVPTNLLTLRENSSRRDNVKLLETKLRQMIREELLNEGNQFIPTNDVKRYLSNAKKYIDEVNQSINSNSLTIGDLEFVIDSVSDLMKAVKRELRRTNREGR